MFVGVSLVFIPVSSTPHYCLLNGYALYASQGSTNIASCGAQGRATVEYVAVCPMDGSKHTPHGISHGINDGYLMRRTIYPATNILDVP